MNAFSFVTALVNLVWGRVVTDSAADIASARAYQRANPEGDALGFLEDSLAEDVEDRLDEVLGAIVIWKDGTEADHLAAHWITYAAHCDCPF